MRERSRSSSSSSRSSHSVKAEEYPEETEEREESSTGFDKSRLGTKEFTGPNERGRARGTFVSIPPRVPIAKAVKKQLLWIVLPQLKHTVREKPQRCGLAVDDEPECDHPVSQALTRVLTIQPGRLNSSCMEQNQAQKLLLISNCWAALMGSVMCISRFGLGYQNDSSGQNPAYCLQFLCLSYIQVLQLGASEVSRQLGGHCHHNLFIFLPCFAVTAVQSKGERMGQRQLFRKQQQQQRWQQWLPEEKQRWGVGSRVHTEEQEVLPGMCLKH